MITHSARRTLRSDRLAEHFIKPLLGGFLGILIALFVPSNILEAHTADRNPNTSPILYMWAIAAIAGLFEARFMRKLQDVADVVFGASGASTGADKKTAA